MKKAIPGETASKDEVKTQVPAARGRRRICIDAFANLLTTSPAFRFELLCIQGYSISNKNLPFPSRYLTYPSGLLSFVCHFVTVFVNPP